MPRAKKETAVAKWKKDRTIVALYLNEIEMAMLHDLQAHMQSKLRDANIVVPPISQSAVLKTALANLFEKELGK